MGLPGAAERSTLELLTPSTTMTFAQVFSRRPTYCGVIESDVFPVQGDIWSGFENDAKTLGRLDRGLNFSRRAHLARNVLCPVGAGGAGGYRRILGQSGSPVKMTAQHQLC